MRSKGKINNSVSRKLVSSIWQAGQLFAVLTLAVCVGLSDATAREVEYSGKEVPVYVTPGEPTQVTFPAEIKGGFKRKHSSLALQRQQNFLVVFAQPEIPYEGEALLVHLDDDTSYALRILPSDDDNSRDEFVKLLDARDEYYDPSESEGPGDFRLGHRGFNPPSTVPGLMREMILLAEFGKRTPIEGYRRSNRYTGETVMHDGTMEVKIDEIFMGSRYWGYVLSVENLLETGQRVNPASFRLDGTRAVTAERWELSPQPRTAEQKIAGGHRGKIYVVTKAHKR